jgi:2-amino-4-hydroxy-6-hydroxymethyldihydropteridine diphosphokinase
VSVYIGLGSNVGDRLENLRRAVTLLDSTDGVEVVVSSSVYETDPVGPPQPDFLNAVVELRTTLGPRELLARLKEIEADIGRTHSEKWGSREIDLDLLVYGGESIESDDLVVPHPRMAERAFVGVPLAEIVGDAGAELPKGVRRFAGPLR